MIGGGSLPEESLPSRLVAIEAPDLEALALTLRKAAVPVVGRIEHDALLLDPRTVLPGEDETLVSTVRAAFNVK